MFYIFIFIYFFTFAAGVAAFYFYRRNVLSKYLELQNKYKINPDYDSQLLLKDLLGGGGLFKIERLDTENLFYRRG